MEKYYTPAIEEFHVGFEFEEEYVGSVRGMRTWVPTKFRGDYSTNYMYENLTKHKTPRCRVKFLDKEDIESLGFEFKEGTESSYIKDNITMHVYDAKRWNTKNDTITIFKKDLTRAVSKTIILEFLYSRAVA